MYNNDNIKYYALEFYSGIGGFHCAFKKALQEIYENEFIGKIVGAFDINNLANQVYKHNFQIDVNNTNIENLTKEKIDKYHANMWWISPPCQPYTRQGLQKGNQDKRSTSFLCLINLIKQLKNQPQYILIENVKDFEILMII